MDVPAPSASAKIAYLSIQSINQFVKEFCLEKGGPLASLDI